MLTISELANELGITAQAIYKRKATDSVIAAALASGSVRRGKRVELTQEAEKAIREAFKSHTSEPAARPQSLHILEDVIINLQKQLESKDKQIDELHNLLNQQQHLQMKTQLLLEAPQEEKKKWWHFRKQSTT